MLNDNIKEEMDDLENKINTINNSEGNDNILNKRLSKTLSDISNDLVYEARERMPESVFLAHFIDFFLEGPSGPDDNRLKEWLSIAGGYYQPVIIYKDATNENLFEVPPIITRPVINKNEDKLDINKIGLTAEQKNKWVSGSGDIYLDNIINSDEAKNSFIEYDKASTNNYLDTWREIYKRYYIIPETEEQKEEKKKTDNLNSILSAYADAIDDE